MREALNIPITELADTDPRELKLVVGPLVSGDLRPYHGRQITHALVRLGRLSSRPRCNTKGARLKVTAWEGAVSCVLCLALKRQS